MTTSSHLLVLLQDPEGSPPAAVSPPAQSSSRQTKRPREEVGYLATLLQENIGLVQTQDAVLIIVLHHIV